MFSLARLFQIAALCALTSVLVFAQSAAPATPASGTYKVVLNRPSAKGDTYKLSVQLKDHEEGSQGIQDEVATLAGTVRVMDVNAIGEPSVLMIHVDKAETGSKDKMKNLKLLGADIGISFPSDTPRFIRRDGQTIPEEELGLLSMVFRAPKGTPADDYLGPGKEVSPGDTWSMNKDILAKVLYGKVSDPKNSPDLSKQEATVTFVGAENWEGVPCYRLNCKIVLKNPDPHFVGDFYTEISQSLLLPTDKSINKSRKSWEMLTDVRGYEVSPTGEKTEMKGKSRMSIETTIQ